MRRTDGPTVVKLGGSLAGSPHLEAWLTAIAALPSPAVLVPGGGPFADQVRALQEQRRFGEPLAHHLAIRAMELFGHLLAGLDPRLVPAAGETALTRVLARGATPVWLPAEMTLGRPEIPESWEVTSDSLAAWLAQRLRAPRLVLVKSRRPDRSAAALEDLVRDGLIDPALPRFFDGAARRAWCLAAPESGRLAALATGAPEGTEIVTGSSC